MSDMWSYQNLVEALKFNPSIEQLQLYPEAVKLKDENGDLPLHTALKWKVSNDVIKIIFQAYLEAVKEQDKYGYLPKRMVMD
jgi:hypothetical protein